MIGVVEGFGMIAILHRSRAFLRSSRAKRRSRHREGSFILNEAVHFEKRVIFIAIPKTGTTTVRSQIRQPGTSLIPNSHLDIMQVRDALYVYLLKNSLGRNTDFPTRSVPRDTDLRAQAKDVFDTFFKFSAVRNPWARAVSLYFRREGVRTRDRLSFEEFCNNHLYASDTCVHPTLHENQLDWLCDETGQCIMDYVYKVENFETACSEIDERTAGRLKLTHIVQNRNSDSQACRYREIYTDKTKRIIESRFQRDIDYFKYTF
jgi:hypothetical protein